MNTEIVTIDLGERSYDIYIGSDLLSRLENMIPFDIAGGRFFVICDENTRIYADTVSSYLSSHDAKECDILSLPAGEATKSFANFEKTCEWLLSRKIDRTSVVFAVGGGVIGDLAGFAAASVLRGVPFVQIPTSLLAQVDSSVGGKTGINTSAGKNLIGSFYQPTAVLADMASLKTLPERELRAGYAEIVKYGLIADYGFFDWLVENGAAVLALDEEALRYAIRKSVEAKAAIVRADEREAGRRALLNLGHTFGHALEAAAGYNGTLLHGEAVAIGMVMAFDLSARMELCAADEVERVEAHLAAMGLPTRASMVPGLSTSVDAQIELMSQDKKVQNGQMRYIVVNEIGNAVVSSDVPVEIVRDVVRDSLGGDTIKNTKAAGASTGLINQSFTNQGVRGLWRSVFSSQSSQ